MDVHEPVLLGRLARRWGERHGEGRERQEQGSNRPHLELDNRHPKKMIWVFPKIRYPKMDGL